MDTDYIVDKILGYQNQFSLIEGFGADLDKYINDTPVSLRITQLNELKNKVLVHKEFSEYEKKYASEIINSRIER